MTELRRQVDRQAMDCFATLAMTNIGLNP